MSSDLDKLKELFQGYAASKASPSREGCPAAAEIVDSFEPGASRRQKKRVIEHIAGCPFCREEFMMLVRRRAAEGVAEAPAPSWAAGRRARVPLWRFAAAMIGLVLTVSSLVVVVRQRDRWNVIRSGGAAIRLLAPKPDQRLSSPPLCRWEDRADADHYILELFDEALLPVWTSGPISGSELRLPPEVYARLLQGRRYFWMVTGYSGQAPIGESRMGRFVVIR